MSADHRAEPGAAVRPRLRFTRVCAVTPGERVFRAILAVIVGAFALSNGSNLWCAVPAAICSLLLVVGAVTGWCPTSLLPRREPDAEANTLGFPEARQRIEV